MGTRGGVALEEPGANTGGTHEKGPYLLPSVMRGLGGRAKGKGGIGMVETGHGGGREGRIETRGGEVRRTG